MNTVIYRATSALTKHAFRSTFSTRALSTLSTRALTSGLTCRVNTTNTHLAQAPKINLNNIRWYSSDKFTPAQIEDKVLDIIKNFDRIKENPAKPQVMPLKAECFY